MDTSLSVGIALAQQMQATQAPNTGLIPESPVAAYKAAELWFDNMQCDGIDVTVVPRSVGAMYPPVLNSLYVGCVVAACSWLVSQGYPLSMIQNAAASATVFADIYAALTGDDRVNAIPEFLKAVRTLPHGVQSNDPFGSLMPAQPAPLSMAQKIHDLVVKETASGTAAPQIVNDIGAILNPPSAGD
jgi:hypothetical protein